MDIIVFTNPTFPTQMQQAVIVPGLKSKMWVERYRQPGEFKFVAPASAAIRALLPIGSFVSHTETSELMIVENHELSEARGRPSNIIITGRSYETYLENRVVGIGKAGNEVASATELDLPSGTSWEQAHALVRRYIEAGTELEPHDRLLFVALNIVVSQVASVRMPRKVKTGTLYAGLMELLDIDDLGIKIVRPGLGNNTVNVIFRIHDGIDRSATVSFAYEKEEIDSADYLWSNKSLKTSAFIRGKWLQTRVDTGPKNYDRRIMFVSATDIDDDYDTAPTGTLRDTLLEDMRQRGIAALAASRITNLVKAEATKAQTDKRFRVDYEVGDIVGIHGEYDISAKMRVSEYVEIDDDTGAQGYPTLSTVDNVTPAQLYRATVMADGPTAYWPLEDTSGTVATDVSGGDRHGTYEGVSLAVAGITSGDVSANFDGNDRVVVPYSSVINPATWTWEAWVRVTGGTGTRNILSARNGFAGHILRVNSDGQFAGFLTDGASYQSLLAGLHIGAQWAHLVHTYANGVHLIYMNGVPKAFAPRTTVVRNNLNPLYIGSGQDTGDAEYFVGQISQVALYSRALTPEKVKAHYEVLRPPA